MKQKVKNMVKLKNTYTVKDGKYDKKKRKYRTNENKQKYQTQKKEEKKIPSSPQLLHCSMINIIIMYVNNIFSDNCRHAKITNENNKTQMKSASINILVLVPIHDDKLCSVRQITIGQ